MEPEISTAMFTLPEIISDKAEAAAEAAMSALSPRLRTPLMRELMLACIYDGSFRQRFRADPRGVCERIGVDLELNSRVKLDVHENDPDTVHLILPGVDIRFAPDKGESVPRVPLAVYEAKARGEEVLEISDDDLESGPVIALLEDDFHDKRDEKNADKKGDTGGIDSDGGGDSVGWDANDNDSGADTGKDPL